VTLLQIQTHRVFPIEIASLSKDRINDLADAVHQAKGKSLGHCNAADLVVYEAGTNFPRKEEVKLSPSSIVPKNTTDENTLRVLAAANLNQHGKNVSVLLCLLIILVVLPTS
jgi:hypothetical protein